LALAVSAFGGLGGCERVRVRGFERIVAEDEPEIPGEPIQHHPDSRFDAFAAGALEVAILDDGYGSIRGSDRVIGTSDD